MMVIILLSGICFAQGSNIYPFSMEYDPERTLLRSVSEPPGYERFPSAKMTQFMAWLTNIPLKDIYHPVTKYNGQIIIRSDSIIGVVDIGITSKNQRGVSLMFQVAAEYLRVVGQLENFPIVLSR
jgi:hypothetical protein